MLSCCSGRRHATPQQLWNLNLNFSNDFGEYLRRRQCSLNQLLSMGNLAPCTPHPGTPTLAVSEIRERWQVCNQLGGPRATAIADSEKAKFMKFVPWAGVAARLATTEVVPPPADGGESKSLPPSPRGAAYCFLPLPVQTGLPVHVNGYFELSSNR